MPQALRPRPRAPPPRSDRLPLWVLRTCPRCPRWWSTFDLRPGATHAGGRHRGRTANQGRAGARHRKCRCHACRQRAPVSAARSSWHSFLPCSGQERRRLHRRNRREDSGRSTATPAGPDVSRSRDETGPRRGLASVRAERLPLKRWMTPHPLRLTRSPARAPRRRLAT